MARRVANYVHVVNPDDGTSAVFGPDDAVPSWAVKLIDNESVWGEDDGEPDSGSSDSSDKPAGNASTEAWQEYAKSQGATDADVEGKSRDELRDTYGN